MTSEGMVIITVANTQVQMAKYRQEQPPLRQVSSSHLLPHLRGLRRQRQFKSVQRELPAHRQVLLQLLRYHQLVVVVST